MFKGYEISNLLITQHLSNAVRLVTSSNAVTSPDASHSWSSLEDCGQLLAIIMLMENESYIQLRFTMPVRMNIAHQYSPITTA